MVSYLLTATAVIFASVIVSLLLPEGRLHKTITFVMRLVCILTLMQPVLVLFKLPQDTSQQTFADYAFVEMEYTRHQSGQLQKLILQKFGIECKCFADVGYSEGVFKVENVEVELQKENCNLIDDVYAYLEELGYINISVYAKSS